MLEAELGKPAKTPDNSSVPPSQGHKSNREERRVKKRKGHPGAFRQLSETPDRVVEALAAACPHCEHVLCATDQSEFHAYDHIDLPPIKPVVTRVHRHRGICPCCRRGFSAPCPEGMTPGSPFGPGLAALILHLHVTQAISFERLVRLMDEVFGVTISEGAIANLLARAEAPMIIAAEKIAEDVRSSPVVASDETSARVKGKTWWQWVLLSSTAIYHVIADSRGAKVVIDFLQGAVPEVWVADRYAAQNGHGIERPLPPRPSAARQPICHRRGRHRLRARFQNPPLARRRHRPATREPRRQHAGSIPGPISTAASPGCWGSLQQPRPAASSPAPSENAATIFSSSSPDAMCRTPTTVASGRCGPLSSSERSAVVFDPIGAPGSMPLRPPSSPPGGSTGNPPFRPSRTSSPRRRQRSSRDLDLSSYPTFPQHRSFYSR